MIKSMTGFGRSEAATKERKIIVEMKAVNHRYCDINIRMPKKLGFFEASIRNLMKKFISRGKIDVFITYEDYRENNLCVRYNEEIAREYLNHLNRMSETFGLETGVNAARLSRYPEVLTLEEQTMDEEELWKALEEVVKEACEQFVKARKQEGEALRMDLLDKLDKMAVMVEKVEKRYPDMVADYHQKIYDKVNELLNGAGIDEGRIATEVTLYADKICVDEETVRLRSHMEHMRQTLLEGESVGRKLDFIAQEMNREANTILSKANDLEISNVAIDLKTEIERVREQIQNIE
ncbi:MAG: YicC/YloC family endoribonuclease [Lachnospiraceae bacterium]|nr:YicC/YloC family endoribonuclease [Lachnospiraceae bacterium]